jgi:atypical dual specificity phosphatase
MLYNFSWLIPEKLAGMARPTDEPATAEALQAEGIRGVVTLTMRPLPRHIVGRLDYLHLPIEDFEAPTREQVRRFIRFVERHAARGEPVVAHCTAGMGRTGTMLACYLVHTGLGAAEAIERVRQARPGSVETREQERAIHDYARELASEG